MNLPHYSQIGKNWLWHALFFGLLLLIQVTLALFRDLPIVTADETVYLAHARYLSGAAPMPTLQGTVFFHFGYSLFLVPVHLLFKDPYLAYKASLIVSALLMGTLYFSLYYILASLLGIPSRYAVLSSFVTCLYSPLLLRANFAWAENAYVPGFMLLIALYGILVRRRSLGVALLIGILLGVMYAIHPRSLPLIPLAALFIVSLCFLHALQWRALSAALAVTGVIFIGTRYMLDHLKSASPGSLSEVPIRPLIAHLLTLEGLHDIILTLNQQILYLIHSSYGLFLVGVVATGFFLWRNHQLGLSGFLRDVPSATVSFFLLAWLGSLVLSAAFLASPTEAGQFLMGRYVDGNSALFLALGLCSILGGLAKEKGNRTLSLLLIPGSVRLHAIFLASLTLSTLAAIYGISVFLPSIVAPNSLGIYPYLAIFGPTALAFVSASVIAAVGFVLITLARGRLRIAAVATIAGLFLLTSAYGYLFAILPLQARVARTSTLASYVRTYLGAPEAIAYDLTYYHPLSYFTYEYLLPHTRFIPFDGAAGEKPPANVVIGGPRWGDAESHGAQFWQVEPRVTTVGANQALWTLPGPQQSDLLQHVDYTNTVLGGPLLPAWGIDTPQGRPVQTVWAVWQRSFYHPEITTIDTSLVWFDADAALRIPYGTRPPQAILLNFINPAGEEKPLQIDVNGESIFAGAIPSGNWCEAFPLPVGSGGSVNVELSRPTRELLLVRGITLLDHVPDMQLRDITTGPLPASGYRSQLALESPLYPQTLARNTMGTVRLSVTNTSDQIWPTSCEVGNSPGAVQLGILWFRKHSGDRRLSDRIAEGRAALPYGLAPGRSLTLTVILAPVKQDGDPLSPGEYEVWIGPVQEGVTWFFQEGDDVLTLPVRIVR